MAQPWGGVEGKLAAVANLVNIVEQQHLKQISGESDRQEEEFVMSVLLDQPASYEQQIKEAIDQIENISRVAVCQSGAEVRPLDTMGRLAEQVIGAEGWRHLIE